MRDSRRGAVAARRTTEHSSNCFAEVNTPTLPHAATVRYRTTDVLWEKTESFLLLLIWCSTNLIAKQALWCASCSTHKHILLREREPLLES